MVQQSQLGKPMGTTASYWLIVALYASLTATLVSGDAPGAAIIFAGFGLAIIGPSAFVTVY